MLLVQPLDLEPQRRSEVFLVADHHIHKRRKRSIHLASSVSSTYSLPQRLSIVEIVRNNSTAPRASLHRFACCLWRLLTQRSETPAGVKPSRTFPGEDLVPIDVSRLQLRRGGVPAVRTAYRRTNAETSFGKIQAVPHAPSDSIVLDPADMRLIHATLINQVLNQPADRVVGKRSH